jgi:hypothetical protein
LQKTKKAVNIDSLDLAPLSELEPVKKVEEVLAPLKAPRESPSAEKFTNDAIA